MGTGDERIMKTEAEIRQQVAAQQAEIARHQQAILTAQGVIGGLLYALGEIGTAPQPTEQGSGEPIPSDDGD